MGALQLFRFPFKAMDSACDVRLFAESEKQARDASGMVIAEIVRLESEYAFRSGDNFLSTVNRAAAAGGKLTVNDESAGLLNYAAKRYAESDGLIDITADALRHVWRFEHGTGPDEADLARHLEKVGWSKVRWEPPLLSFAVAGMELNFGALVNEYAADRAANVLRAAGIEHAMVNLGGDVHIVGPPADDDAWRVGIRHPLEGDGMAPSILVREGALAVCGDYERCIVVDGTRYGRAFNPRTGWPVRRMAAVTVVADLCVTAGSAAAMAMLKDDAGPTWLEQRGLPYLWTDTEGHSGGPLLPADGAAVTAARP